jgi:hypothetical protein
MLRWTLGDDLFFKGIRSYLSDPALQYGFARTADLQRNLETVSSVTLGYFFNQWYAGQGYPSFTVRWSQDANNIATITVSQSTSMPSSVAFFQVPLELTFKNAAQQKTIVVQNTVNNQTVTADIGFKATKVIIDPNKYLISKNNQSIHTTLAPAQSLGPVTVSPNPFTDRVIVTLKQADGRQIVFRLFDSFGHPVLTRTEIADGSDETFRLDVPANLAPGNYLLTITAAEKSFIRYLQKE